MPENEQRRGDGERTENLPGRGRRRDQRPQRPGWGEDDPFPPARPRQHVRTSGPVQGDTTQVMPTPTPGEAPPPARPRPSRGARRPAPREPLPPRLSLPADADEARYAEAAPAGRGPVPPPAGPPPARPAGAPRRDPRPPRRRRRPPFVLLTFLTVLALLLGYLGWMWLAVGHVWDARGHADATPTAADRPAPGKGKNFLIVGSDGRNAAGGTVGDTATSGTRTDTIMLMHVPDDGKPTLVSIPRDSFVTIRANKSAPAGKHKINAAFAWGGPQLLVDTVEQATKLRVDGYLEVGFGGFQQAIDSVDGVQVCPQTKIDTGNAKVGVLPAGCQTLNGEQALAYVRMRYNDKLGDIGRAQRQREVLAALIKKVATPANALLPWRVEKVGTPLAQIVTVGDGTSKKDALDLFLALRDISGGNGTSTVVPCSDLNLRTVDGSSVAWDEEKAGRLWDALRNDRPVPADVLAVVPGKH